MHSMRANVHAKHIEGWLVVWFRPQPRNWNYRVVLVFKNLDAANAYMRWHNKWIDENVAR